MMRTMLPALFLIMLVASPTGAARFDSLADFAPGLYVANPIGGSGIAHRECLSEPGALITGGRPVGACTFNHIGSSGQQSVITWQCRGGDQGRTTVRRDSAGVYTVHLQGVGNRLPFAEHAEWRRLGDC